MCMFGLMNLELQFLEFILNLEVSSAFVGLSFFHKYYCPF